MNDKTIYILIGKKGSGKSFIGMLMEKEFHVKFISVENLALQIIRKREIDDPSYINEYFQALECELRTILETNDKIVFESTGLTDNFDQMLENLRKEFSVITIGIKASDELCITRVKNRDQTIHIDVSDDQVKHINERVNNKNFAADYFLANENKTIEHLVHQMSQIIK